MGKSAKEGGRSISLSVCVCVQMFFQHGLPPFQKFVDVSLG